MKKETKVAWPKTHPWNSRLIELLRAGDDIAHADLLAATEDADHRKVFDLTSARPLKKETHVIFLDRGTCLLSCFDGLYPQSEFLAVTMKPTTEADHPKRNENIWDKVPAKGIYESWTPDDFPECLKPFYSIEFANQSGFSTGRDRFKVTCLRCHILLHPATTAPDEYVRMHEMHCAEQFAG